MENIPFGYSPKTFTFVNIACDKLAASHPCFDAENSGDFLLIGSYQNQSMANPVYILFSPGPSVDPFFGIKDAQGREVWGTAADEMCINDNGIIYTAGHTNAMFNERHKYIFANGRVREVPQPYMYVGIKDKTLKTITLYSQKEGGEVVATLPKGYEVEVLLADEATNESSMNNRYLVRTSFGLVGWLRLSEDETFGSPVLNELRFWGD